MTKRWSTCTSPASSSSNRPAFHEDPLPWRTPSGRTRSVEDPFRGGPLPWRTPSVEDPFGEDPPGEDRSTEDPFRGEDPSGGRTPCGEESVRAEGSLRALQEVGDQGRPPCLMARPESFSTISVEVLVKEQVV